MQQVRLRCSQLLWRSQLERSGEEGGNVILYMELNIFQCRCKSGYQFDHVNPQMNTCPKHYGTVKIVGLFVTFVK